MKVILISAGLLAAATTAFAQGWVNFANSPLTRVSTNAALGMGNAGLIAGPIGSYYFALLVAPTNQTSVDQSLSGWSFTGAYATNMVSAGRFYGGNVFVSGFGTGPANFVVVGWSSDVGHDWAAVVPRIMQGYGAGFAGVSGIVSNVTLGPIIGPASPLPLPGGFTLWEGCLGPYWEGFTLQPTNQTVILGATVVFAVRATACPLPAYQWYFNGAPIAAATDSAYQITSAQPADAGQYDVVLSNPSWPACCGGPTHTSDIVTLTVLTPPSIILPPQTQTAEAGSAVQFHASATGWPSLEYQWLFNNALAAAGTGGRSTLVITNVQSAQAGTYAVSYSNLAGCVTSPPATLNVISPIPHVLVPALAISGQPAGFLHLETACLPVNGSWLPLDTVELTNASQWYFDLASVPATQCFYRAWLSAPTSHRPALNLYFVPAITLTGSIGNSVRLDCINQFGPTTDWVPLATITFTNRSQLYFDTSAIGQPPRLWRTVPTL